MAKYSPSHYQVVQCIAFSPSRNTRASLFSAVAMVFEPTIAPTHAQIDHPLNVPDPYDETDEFKRRATSFAAQYRPGRHVFLQSTTLKGPFGAGWVNPWLSDNHVRHNKQRTIHNRKMENAKAAPFQATPHRQTVKKARCNPQSEKEGSASYENQVKSTEECSTSNDNKPVQAATNGSQSRIHRYQSDTLLTPSASRPRNLDRSSATDSGKAQALEPHDCGFGDQPWESTVPTSLQTVQKHSARAVALRGIESTHEQISTASKRECAWCKTMKTHQWRKGPSGPRTLCSSCGAKWTHRQKRLQEAIEERNRGLGHGSTTAKKNQKYTQKQKDKSTHPQATAAEITPMKLPSHRKICQEVFRDPDIRRAVLADRGAALERLLMPQVVNLRGYPPEKMQSWGEAEAPETGPFPDNEFSNDRLTVTSRISPKISSKGQTINSQLVPNALKARKRKMTTFDTTKNQAQMTSRKASEGPSPVLQLPGIYSIPNNRLGSKDENFTPSGPGDYSVQVRDHLRKTVGEQTAQPSTQADLSLAQREFQDNLQSSPDNNQVESLPTKAFFKTPAYRGCSQTYTHDCEPFPTDPVVNTQDLFNQNLHFSSSSPLEEHAVQDIQTSIATSQPKLDAANDDVRRGRLSTPEPLLSSWTRLVKRPSPRAKDGVLKQDVFAGLSQPVDVEEVMRDAGCFLNTWEVK